MNGVLNKYLISGFLKIVFNTVLIFISLGIILNLFEEIEFFKNLNESLSLPFVMSLSFVPTLILELLPFIIFLATMWYFISIKANTDLLSIKTFGYSNLKVSILLSLTAFIFGLFILIAVNPITSTLVKYYEQEKARYSRDIDHLISINKNGVWIKEATRKGPTIISAKKFTADSLGDVTIYIFNNNNEIVQRIESEKINIKSNPWQMEKAKIYNFINSENIIENTVDETNYLFESEYTFEKISSLYKNLNTVSFISLLTDYEELNERGYSKKILNEKLNKFISLPVFLSLMVFLAAIFTIGSLKKTQNLYFFFISIITCVVIYYFKDFSLALGQTERITLILSVWMPIIAITLFCSIGIIQINEK